MVASDAHYVWVDFLALFLGLYATFQDQVYEQGGNLERDDSHYLHPF